MENKKAVSYDYKIVRVKRKMEVMTIDAYEALGWELVGSSASEGAIFYVSLSFKRDRKIADKQNLLKMQEKADSTLLSIDTLQNKKQTAGMIPSMTTGVVGTLIFGGGMSLALLESGKAGMLAGGIILGVAGMIVASFAYFIYKKCKRKTLNKVEPMLESELNKLADICEEAKTK